MRADWTLTASSGAIRSSSLRSSSVNGPPRLLIAWHTPIAWSSTTRGTEIVLRVWNSRTKRRMRRGSRSASLDM